MTTAVRERVLAAAAAKLAAIAGIPGLVVERNRRDPVARLPLIVLRDGGARVADRATGKDRLEVGFDVECYATGDDGAALGAALSELAAAAQAAILADVTLGVGAWDARLEDVGDPVFDVSDASGTVASLAARFTVEAWVVPDDPYTLAP